MAIAHQYQVRLEAIEVVWDVIHGSGPYQSLHLGAVRWMGTLLSLVVSLFYAYSRINL